MYIAFEYITLKSCSKEKKTYWLNLYKSLAVTTDKQTL